MDQKSTSNWETIQSVHKSTSPQKQISIVSILQYYTDAIVYYVFICLHTSSILETIKKLRT